MLIPTNGQQKDKKKCEQNFKVEIFNAKSFCNETTLDAIHFLKCSINYYYSSDCIN